MRAREVRKQAEMLAADLRGEDSGTRLTVEKRAEGAAQKQDRL